MVYNRSATLYIVYKTSRRLLMKVPQPPPSITTTTQHILFIIYHYNLLNKFKYQTDQTVNRTMAYI